MTNLDIADLVGSSGGGIQYTIYMVQMVHYTLTLYTMQCVNIRRLQCEVLVDQENVTGR